MFTVTELQGGEQLAYRVVTQPHLSALLYASEQRAKGKTGRCKHVRRRLKSRVQTSREAMTRTDSE